ncbi:MAG: DUF547 domain-containing protein [Pseudomonadota bacterium]
MQRRDVLLAAAGASLLAFAGRAHAAPGSELIDDHWLAEGGADAGALDHVAWHQWLLRYVVESADGVNRVRYGDVTREDRDSLRRYIDDMAAVDVTAYVRAEQMAYWVNLYNALTVDVILSEYPVSSIRDINDGLFSFGPWGRDVITVEGRTLTLDDIEHGILRPIWRDPRIHYVVNCASIGCPNLAKAAYWGNGIDSRLTQAAYSYVNDPRGAEVSTSGRLVVSSLYLWFEEDFGGSESGVIDHLTTYATNLLRTSLSGVSDIHDDRYDWSLNDATGMPAQDPGYKGSGSKGLGTVDSSEAETSASGGAVSGARLGSSHKVIVAEPVDP